MVDVPAGLGIRHAGRGSIGGIHNQFGWWDSGMSCHVEVFPITPAVGGSHAHIAHASCKPSHHTPSCHNLRAWPAIGTRAIWANFGCVGRVVGASTRKSIPHHRMLIIQPAHKTPSPVSQVQGSHSRSSLWPSLSACHGCHRLPDISILSIPAVTSHSTRCTVSQAIHIWWW